MKQARHLGKPHSPLPVRCLNCLVTVLYDCLFLSLSLSFSVSVCCTIVFFCQGVFTIVLFFCLLSVCVVRLFFVVVFVSLCCTIVVFSVSKTGETSWKVLSPVPIRCLVSCVLRLYFYVSETGTVVFCFLFVLVSETGETSCKATFAAIGKLSCLTIVVYHCSFQSVCFVRL